MIAAAPAEDRTEFDTLEEVDSAYMGTDETTLFPNSGKNLTKEALQELAGKNLTAAQDRWRLQYLATVPFTD